MRGCQKKVIYVKNTGSRHFEEAYFVMRPECDGAGVSRLGMIKEANRIITENFEKKSGGFIRKKKWYILAFLAGCAVSFVLCLVAGLLI